MATVRCKGCSQLVAFRGKSAACPECGALLRIHGPGDLLDVGESADPRVGPEVPTLVIEYGRTRAPTYAQGAKAKHPYAKWAVIGGMALVFVVVGLSGLWWLLSRPSSVVPPAPPPPVTMLPPPAPTPEPPRRARADDAPPATAPSTAPATAPAPPPVWTALRPERPSIDLERDVTDARVEAAVRRGLSYLRNRFDGPNLIAPANPDDKYAGLNALAVYAMLAAGKDLQDPEWDVRSPRVREVLERVKTINPAGGHEVYNRSVRLQCLAFANRPEDRPAMEADLRWLLRATISGAFLYEMPPPGATLERDRWDLSNSQYGMLGVWAASMAGLDTPIGFWADIEQFYLTYQDGASGGWAYDRERNGGPTVAMTTAGVNALLVSGDMLGTSRLVDRASNRRRDPTNSRQAVLRGLEFLAKDGRLLNDFHQHGYAIYGIERVGLASGMKYIGEVDWYRALAARQLAKQREDGGWNATGSPEPAETAFNVLFLVRGRPPVMMSKLRYDLPEKEEDLTDPRRRAAAATQPVFQPWAKNPRDVANLAFYAGQKTERPLNWQVVDLKRGWRDWLDAPVLFVSGDRPPTLSDADVENFRQFVANGGLVFSQADGGSEAFTKWASELAGKLTDDNTPLSPLPPDHPVYSMVFRPNPAPPLMGVSNGNRLLWVHSPGEISNRWLRRVPAASQQNLEMGLNVFIYAAGKGLVRNRLQTPVLGEPGEPPVGTMPVARIMYGKGLEWDPEPAAWPRAGRALELATRIKVELREVAPRELPPSHEVPMAVLTVGPRGGATLRDADFAALRQWVESGGVLVIDPVGGSQAAVAGVGALTRGLLGATPPAAPLTSEHPWLTGSGLGSFGADVRKVALTDYTIGEKGGRLPAPRATRLGKGWVVSSELDLTTALLAVNTWGVSGYSSDWAMGFMRNLMLSVATGDTRQNIPTGGTDRPRRNGP